MDGWPRFAMTLLFTVTALAGIPCRSLGSARAAPPPASVPTGPAKATPPSTAPAPLLPGTPSHTAGVVPRPPPPVESRSLSIVVGGAVKATLTTADLARVTPLPSPLSTGGKQTLWPLKDVLALFLKKDARVVAVILDAGQRVPLDENLWSDPSKVPALWQNRRGLFKLGWTDGKGIQIPKSTELRDVRALEVVLPVR